MGNVRSLIAKLRANHHFHQLVKYLSVGVVNTAVIFGLFFLFNDVFRAGAIWSNRVAYAGGLITNFTLNKAWTFKSRKFRPVEIVLFLLAWGISYGVQFLCFRLLMDIMGWDESWAALLAYPLYGLAFYLQSKFVVFNRNLGRSRGAAGGESSESLEAG